MENYRKVHLRGVLINNTSRLRYLAQPEERGLSHSCQTQWVVGASESSWEVAATATKSNPAFQVQSDIKKWPQTENF